MVDDARTDIDELYDRLEVKEKTKEDIMKVTSIVAEYRKEPRLIELIKNRIDNIN